MPNLFIKLLRWDNTPRDTYTRNLDLDCAVPVTWVSCNYVRSLFHSIFQSIFQSSDLRCPPRIQSSLKYIDSMQRFDLQYISARILLFRRGSIICLKLTHKRKVTNLLVKKDHWYSHKTHLSLFAACSGSILNMINLYNSSNADKSLANSVFETANRLEKQPLQSHSLAHLHETNMQGSYKYVTNVR